MTANISIGDFSATKVVEKQRAFFNTGTTKDVDFRITQLKKIRQLVVDNERAILDALYKDLKKGETEAYTTEVGFVLLDIDHAIANVKKWAKPTKVKTPLFHQLGSSWIANDPFGVTYIIAPWNYPFQLLIAPMIGAIAAGNTCILKPSELTVNTANLLEKLINENFDEGFLKVVLGGVQESKALLEEKFDFIFFTGGTEIGRYIYQCAAKHLTPVILELGGKSPVFFDENVNWKHGVNRLVWGKFTNVGQTCVAPDYILVHKNVKAKLIEEIKKTLAKFYGENPQKSDDYGRIVNERHFLRLARLLENQNVVCGGQTDIKDLYIAPTILDNASLDSPIMNEEIFGPILPIIEYEDLNKAIDFVNARSKPLALYIFSEDRLYADTILQKTSSGNASINECLMHVGQFNLPFGGVGDSGIGAYHGKLSFDVFSHKKGVLKKSTLSDLALRYPPYNIKNLPLLKKLLAWLN